MQLDADFTPFLSCRNLGEGLTNLLSDKQKLTAAVGGLTVLALGVYTSKEGTRVAGRAIDRFVKIPSSYRLPQ